VTVEVCLMVNFVLMFTVPDSLIPNLQYYEVLWQTLIQITFWVILKQSKLGKAHYILIQHGKWIFISWICGSCAKRVQWECYRCYQKIHRKYLTGGPTHHTLLSVDCRLQKMGTFHGMWWHTGCPRPIHNAYIKKQILEANARQPTISTRCLAAHTGTFHASVHCTLQEQWLYPCHIQS
jgi:hypothetical protein